MQNDEIKTQVTSRLKNYLEQQPDLSPELKDSIAYSLFASGKRIRPILIANAYYDFGRGAGQDTLAMLDAAAAIEMLHVASLIHDDLPSLDNDSERWGKPCNHLKFSESTALLAADALTAMAFDIVLSSKQIHAEHKASIGAVLTTSFIKLCSGQQYDLALPVLREAHDKDARIDRLKTGALFAACLRIGALLNNCSPEIVIQASQLGESFGVLFQIIDDKDDKQEQDNAAAHAKQGTAAQEFRGLLVSIENVQGERLTYLRATMCSYLDKLSF